jgi:DNA repair exonuclease SbcCD ATPase subunit
MKLHDRIEISDQKANERKLEIQEGAKLAKKIDALRELVAKEQNNLNKFRDESLKQIKKEIDSYIEEKNKLQTEVFELRDERIRLSAPIDLVEEWAYVKREKSIVETQKEENSQTRLSLMAKEIDLIKDKEKLEGDSKEVERLRVHNTKKLIEAEQNFKKSEEIRQSVEQMRDRFISDMEAETKAINIRLDNIRVKEHELNLEKEKVESDQREIQTQWTQIRDQRATLERAFNRLNNK